MRAVTQILDTEQAITRPVAYDIVRKLGELMRLPAGTEVLYPGASDQSTQSGSTIDYVGAPSKIAGSGRISVEVSESNDGGSAPLGENALQEEAPEIFFDRGMAVRLRAHYANVKLTITINVRAQERTEADKLRAEFRSRTSMSRGPILHTLNYHYGVPAEFQQQLQDFWAMREAVAGYGEDFNTWFSKYASQRLRPLPESDRVAFAERQVGVWGRFDFDVAPEEPGKSEPNGTYNFPITYTLSYDKVIGMSIDYPLVIHNQLVADKYIGNPFPGGQGLEDPYASKLYSTKTLAALRGLFLTVPLGPHRIGGIRVPAYDDWAPISVLDRTSTLAAVMLQVNENDLHEVIDLTDLEGVMIDPDIRQYMASQGAKLGVFRQAAVYVELFKNGRSLGDTAIKVDSTLKVRATAPLCLRDRYHLRLSLLTDLTWMPDTARLALRKQGLACQKILLTLQAKLPNGQYVPKLVGSGIIPDVYLLESADRINRAARAYYAGLENQMLTVGNFFITTHRMNQYATDESAGGGTRPVDPSQSDNYEPIVPGHCEPATGCEQPRPF